jgi:hypothetical protein
MVRSSSLMGSIFTTMFVVKAAFALDSDALMEQGVKLRIESKDREALVLFTQADALKSSPRTRAQMAFAEQALGLWVSAEKHLAEALRANQDPWVMKNLTVMRSSLVTIREHLGSLELLGGEPGSEVRMDGVPVGVLPLTEALRLEPGRRELEVRHAGFRTLQRRIVIAEQGQARETLVMMPIDASSSSLPSSIVQGESTDSKRVMVLDDPGRNQRTIGYVLLAASGAAALLGGASLLTRELTSQSYNANPACGRPATEPQDCRDQASNRATWTGVGIGSFIGSGIFLGIGSALLLTAPSATTVKTTSITCGSSLTGVELNCAGTF